MAHAVVVGQVDIGGPSGDSIDDSRTRTGRIVVDGHDRARVDACRSKELVAVLLWAGHRALVREHGALIERMQSKPSEEPALGPGHIGPRHAIGLLVDVERRVWVLAERAIG